MRTGVGKLQGGPGTLALVKTPPGAWGPETAPEQWDMAELSGVLR